MAGVEKPEQILRLEQHLGLRLHPLQFGKITDPQHRKCYQLDANGEIIGLNLSHCSNTDWAFLKELPRLTALNLESNGITDGSFLRGLPRLTSLDLATNELKDWSFLKGLPRLTSLGLADNRIADWSFLRGLTPLAALDLSKNRITDGSFLRDLPLLTSLDLAGNEIKDGSFLRGLTHLTSLHLRDNPIADGSFLRGLPRLTSLDLWGNPIADWSFLRELTHLTSLHLGNSGIIDGSFLTGLPHLTSLELSGERIVDWSFLGGLAHLTSLDLWASQATDGSFLEGLTSLTSLHLRGTEIADWSFLAGFDRLTNLSVWHNGITDGSFLGGLTHLTSLNLGYNTISDGSFLAGLSHLTSLDLGINRITDGSFLGELTHLTTLCLRENQIADWSFLTGLSHLKTLDVRNTKLQALPSEVLRLNIDLEWHEYRGVTNAVNLAENPIETPPLEIVKQGDRAIRAWFAEEEKGLVPLNEVKVILVGDGEAGKTTLRKRLMRLPPDKNESQTHGIEIHPHTVHCGADDIRVHFWDFGGQEILHATHQFFLSRRSLYIVVLDGRKEEDVDYWLKHIESFGGDSPVLICLNKLDQNPSFDVNRVDLRSKYPGIQAFYRLKCLDTKDDGVAQLLKELPEHLMRVELTRAEWPRRWFHVKERLQKEGQPFLKRKEFEGYCREAGIADKDSQNTLVRFLSDLGVALHFDDARLKLLQVLNPKWATQAVYRLISSPSVAAAHGLLKLGDLKSVLAKAKSEDYEYPKDKHRYIANLMRKFELCYDVNDKEVLLPDLLDVDEPSHEFPTENVLRFRYEYDYLPKSIMPRLIVKLHADIDGQLRWRTGVVLKPNRWEARARVKSDKSAKRVTIEVSGPQRREFFAVISDAIESIHEGFTKLGFKRKVPLPDHPEVAVDYEDLIYLREEKEKYYRAGSLKKKYDVVKLLDGVNLVQPRRKAGQKAGDVTHNYYGPYTENDMSRNVNIGDNNRNVGVNFGDHVTQAVADTIRNSFNHAAAAKPVELKDLLEQLTREMAEVIKTLPEEEASKAARHLENATKEAAAEKPSQDFWDFSKNGLIAAAKLAGGVVKQGVTDAAAAANAVVKQGMAGAAVAAGAVGAKIVGLIDQISKHLPF